MPHLREPPALFLNKNIRKIGQKFFIFWVWHIVLSIKTHHWWFFTPWVVLKNLRKESCWIHLDSSSWTYLFKNGWHIDQAEGWAASVSYWVLLNPTFLVILTLYVLSLATSDQPSAAREELHLGIRNVVSCYSWAVSRNRQIMLNSILLSQLRVNICKPSRQDILGAGSKTIIIVLII